MAISPVGPVEGSPSSAPSSGDRRPAFRTPRTTSGSPAETEAGDHVFLSETARDIASAAFHEEPQLHLSPAELRAMIAPEDEDETLKSARAKDDSSSNTEERHVP